MKSEQHAVMIYDDILLGQKYFTFVSHSRHWIALLLAKLLKCGGDINLWMSVRECLLVINKIHTEKRKIPNPDQSGRQLWLAGSHGSALSER